MIKYGLLYKEKVLGYTVQGNEETCRLSAYADNMWLVDTSEHANYVRSNSTPWYNADYDTPVNSYDEKDLQVVEVEIMVRPYNTDRLPSFEDVLRVIYKDEPFHVSYVLETCPVSQRVYSLYDYKRYLEKTK
jgi:hypothetical protein